MVDVCVMVGLGESEELQYPLMNIVLIVMHWSYVFLKRTVGAHNYSKRSLSLSLSLTHTLAQRPRNTHTTEPHEAVK